MKTRKNDEGSLQDHYRLLQAISFNPSLCDRLVSAARAAQVPNPYGAAERALRRAQGELTGRRRLGPAGLFLLAVTDEEARQ